MESNLDGDSEYRIPVNFRVASINRLGAEWRTIAVLGEPFGFETEFYQPMNRRGFWFVAPKFTAARDKRETILTDDSRENVKVRTLLGGFDVGVQFRNWGEIRLGPRVGKSKARTTTTSEFDALDVDEGAWNLRAILDQLDKAFFPRHGTYWQLDGFLSTESLGADDDYDKLSLLGVYLTSRGDHTVGFGVEGGTDLGSDLPIYDKFTLGGFLNLSGFERDELRGDLFGLLSFTYYYRLAEGALGSYYLGTALQAGDVWADSSDVELDELRPSATLFVGLDTALAPIYVGWGYAEGGRKEYYLFVGRVF